jgi:D-alanine-D-alanine ligase
VRRTVITRVCEAVKAKDKQAEIAYVNTMVDFKKAIDQSRFDIIWSALSHASENEAIIGMSADDDSWLADHLDAKGIPYIGPDAFTMKQLIQKYETHRQLHAHGVAVPYHFLVNPGEEPPEVTYPAFVKPSTESRSVGISDNSVVHTDEELAAQVRYIHDTYHQPALVEEYLPGREYTVLMIGNGRLQEFLPGIVKVDEIHYGKYPILRSDLRGVGLTHIHKPETLVEEANALCKAATDTLKCYDHVRVDMRLSAQGQFKVIEVNGIPGLKPGKSWSPQMYTLYYPSPEGPEVDFQNLIHRIVDSGLERYGLN